MATTYSVDENLVPIYYPDAASLPDSLMPLHEEAYAQIQRDLKAQGWTEDDLAILSTASLTELVRPSCCFVMSLIYRGQSAHDRGMESVDKAKYWRSEYQQALSSALIETTDYDDDEIAPPPRSGYVVLG